MCLVADCAQADKYDVPVVIDDTIGSFCNIDVSPVADVIITSITKSVSGYANVSPYPPTPYCTNSQLTTLSR
jgi:cystathionine beta-lyase/cystathionine gamma-synthase